MEKEKLTRRQLEIIRKLDEGKNRKTVADELKISLSTVNTQLNLIFKELDVHSVTEMLHKAREAGYLG